MASEDGGEPALIPQVQSWLTQTEQQAVARVVASNWLSEGAECKAFAARLNTLIDVPYGVFAPNGTLALALGLMALGIGRGDEVLVPDITFIGSATAVVMVGATPIFVDVDPETYQIDVAHAGQLISTRTRAIMPVHLYGAACDMDAVLAFAHKHGLKVIEDAAQGIGVTHRGRHVGGLGDVGCFSFFADKTITTGEGGFVVCRDPEIYERLCYLRNQGRRERGKYIHPMIGYNFRITDLHAAIGLAQLDRLPEIIARKKALHDEYNRLLTGLDEVRVLGAGWASDFVPFRCVLIAERMEKLALHLQAADIQTRTFFYPLHLQPCFADWPRTRGRRPSRKNADYPVSVQGFDHGLCLPIYPTLSLSQASYIAGRIREFYSTRSPLRKRRPIETKFHPRAAKTASVRSANQPS